MNNKNHTETPPYHTVNGRRSTYTRDVASLIFGKYHRYKSLLLGQLFPQRRSLCLEKMQFISIFRTLLVFSATLLVSQIQAQPVPLAINTSNLSVSYANLVWCSILTIFIRFEALRQNKRSLSLKKPLPMKRSSSWAYALAFSTTRVYWKMFDRLEPSLMHTRCKILSQKQKRNGHWSKNWKNGWRKRSRNLRDSRSSSSLDSPRFLTRKNWLGYFLYIDTMLTETHFSEKRAPAKSGRWCNQPKYASKNELLQK